MSVILVDSKNDKILAAKYQLSSVTPESQGTNEPAFAALGTKLGSLSGETW
ncbi:MAG: hypothetical protein ACFB2X_21755 [Rivularia sp. (in: cyanobacteria)]